MWSFFPNIINTGEETVNFRYDQLLFAIDDDGRNILHYAVFCDNINILEFAVLQRLMQYPDSDRLFVACDKQGRTALDYAIMFKKQPFINMLALHTLRVKSVQYVADPRGKTNDPQDFLDRLQSHFTIKGMTLENLPIPEDNRDFFSKTLDQLVSFGYTSSVKWLVDGPWQIDRRLCRNRDVDSFYLEKMLETLKGSMFEKFVNTSASLRAGAITAGLFNPSQPDVPIVSEKINKLLFSTLYETCRKWNDKKGNLEKFLDSIQNKNARYLPQQNYSLLYKVTVYDPYLRGLKGNFATELIQKFLVMYGANLGGSLVRQRYETFEYMCSKLTSRSKIPSLHVFIQGRQSHMLQSYVMMQNIDLQRPLKSDSKLFQFAASLSWTQLIAMSPEITVCQFLTAYAAAVDLLPAFCWLVKQCQPLKFLIGNKNPLQIAAINGAYIVVKHSLMTGRYSKADLVANNLDIVQSVIQNKDFIMADLLVATLGNKSIANHLHSYYALKSSTLITATWRKAVIVLQRQVRGLIVRTKYRFDKVSWRRFNSNWGPVTRELRKQAKQGVTQIESWAAVKRLFDIVSTELSEEEILLRGEESTEIAEITEAVLVAGLADSTVVGHIGEASDVNVALRTVEDEDDEAVAQQAPLDNIELSSSVWFVSKHDDVSKHLQLLNDSSQRLATLPCIKDSAETDSLMLLGDDDVLIDPSGNCPLKVYVSSRGE
eukprot:gene34000-41934_t